jgi:hypothetical protein
VITPCFQQRIEVWPPGEFFGLEDGWCSVFGYLATAGVVEMRLQQPRSGTKGATGHFTRDPVSKHGMATAFVGTRPDVQTLDTATDGLTALHTAHPPPSSSRPSSGKAIHHQPRQNCRRWHPGAQGLRHLAIYSQSGSNYRQRKEGDPKPNLTTRSKSDQRQDASNETSRCPNHTVPAHDCRVEPSGGRRPGRDL